MDTKKTGPIDLTKILRPFKSGWVALSMDYKKVLGHGETLKETRKQAEKSGKKFLFYGIESPLFTRILPKSTR